MEVNLASVLIPTASSPPTGALRPAGATDASGQPRANAPSADSSAGHAPRGQRPRPEAQPAQEGTDAQRPDLRGNAQANPKPRQVRKADDDTAQLPAVTVPPSATTVAAGDQASQTGASFNQLLAQMMATPATAASSAPVPAPDNVPADSANGSASKASPTLPAITAINPLAAAPTMPAVTTNAAYLPGAPAQPQAPQPATTGQAPTAFVVPAANAQPPAPAPEASDEPSVTASPTSTVPEVPQSQPAQATPAPTISSLPPRSASTNDVPTQPVPVPSEQPSSVPAGPRTELPAPSMPAQAQPVEQAPASTLAASAETTPDPAALQAADMPARLATDKADQPAATDAAQKPAETKTPAAPEQTPAAEAAVTAAASAAARQTTAVRAVAPRTNKLTQAAKEAIGSVTAATQKHSASQSSPLSGKPAVSETAPARRTGGHDHAAKTTSVASSVMERPAVLAEEAAGSSARTEMAATVSSSAAQGQTVSAAPVEATARASSADVAPRPIVGDQVVSAVLAGRAAGAQHMTIRLDPPELGAIRVSLQTQGQTVRGVLHVENPETMRQLQREMPSLIERLSEGGLQVKQIDFHLNTNANGSGGGGAFAQAGGWGQFADGGSRGGSGGGASGAPAGDAAAELAQTPARQGQYSDASVNLWI